VATIVVPQGSGRQRFYRRVRAWKSLKCVRPLADMAELARCAGTQFDPAVVRVLSEVVRGESLDGAPVPPTGTAADGIPGRRAKAGAAAT
jgi:hypothetical protein